MNKPDSGVHMRAIPAVHCQQCGKQIFDGLALKTRVVIVGEHSSRAKCPRCKTFVEVPVARAPTR